MVCNSCGAQLTDGSAFCSSCGARIEQQTEESKAQENNAAENNTNVQQSTDNAQIPDDDAIIAFVAGASGDSNSHAVYHYLMVFKKFFSRKDDPSELLSVIMQKISWNWSAFLFPCWNLFWRKLYIHGIVCLLIDAFFSLSFGDVIVCLLRNTDALFSLFFGLRLVVDFLMRVLVGLFADSFYFSLVLKKFEEAKRVYPDDVYSQKYYLSQNGGTAKWVIAASILSVLVGLLQLVASVAFRLL